MHLKPSSSLSLPQTTLLGSKLSPDLSRGGPYCIDPHRTQHSSHEGQAAILIIDRSLPTPDGGSSYILKILAAGPLPSKQTTARGPMVYLMDCEWTKLRWVEMETPHSYSEQKL